MSEFDQSTALPEAETSPRQQWLWAVPLLAIVIVLILAVQAWRDRGMLVTITFADGHGITVGDSVKHRGITVGKVRRVGLTADADGVNVIVAFSRDAAGLAREGSRFWLVRPEIGLSRIAGLETIVGARYIGVLPGSGAMVTEFRGLEAPPVIVRAEEGDLEIIVEASRRGSLAPGSPVVYRQVQIGTVVAVALAPDAAAVEVRIHIMARYAPLIRRHTRFWDAGGLDIGVGLTGFRATVESTELLLRGGLGVATPPDAGPEATSGTRFRIDPEPKREWADWRPPVRLAE